MAFWIYLLRCSDGSYYTGHTDNLEQRVAQHEAGALGEYTRLRKPLHLVYTQEFPTRDEALAAEMQVKRWSRRKKEALIRGDWDALKIAARKSFDRKDRP